MITIEVADPRRRSDAPVGQLSPQPWMTAPATRAVMAALRADGATVRFVGGAVRDAVAKRPVHDIDIATPDPPARVLALLDDAGIRAIPTGLAHGTVTAVIGGTHFEITTLRVDVATDGRHARVAFTDDWVADAARRDFTFNALSADAEGRIYDPFDGLADLGAGRVRFVGDAAQRIAEDGLRLLRFFRFHAYYGQGGSPDPATLLVCRRLAPMLTRLSGERVAAELLRLLAAFDPASTIVTMQAFDVLPVILPEADTPDRLRQLAWLEERGLARAEIGHDPLRRLAALLRPGRERALAVAARLKLSGADRDRLAGLSEPVPDLDPGLDLRSRRRLLRRLGTARVRDLILLAWAGRRVAVARPSAAESAGWIGLLDDAAAWTPVALPIQGRDLLAMGVPPGPEVGRWLAAIELWWEERDYRPDRADCLAEAARRLGVTAVPS